MIKLETQEAEEQLKRLSAVFSERELLVAKVRAMNVAIEKAKTQYRRSLVEIYNFSKYEETKYLVYAQKATYGNPFAAIRTRSDPMSLSRFNPEMAMNGGMISIQWSKKDKAGKKTLQQVFKKKEGLNEGMKVEVKRSEPKIVANAFFIQSDKSPSLRKQIWIRGSYFGGELIRSDERKPITALKTASVHGMANNEGIEDKIRGTFPGDMQKEFNRQIGQLVKKLKQ